MCEPFGLSRKHKKRCTSTSKKKCGMNGVDRRRNSSHAIAEVMTGPPQSANGSVRITQTIMSFGHLG
jgi:hypothetical protein